MKQTLGLLAQLTVKAEVALMEVAGPGLAEVGRVGAWPCGVYHGCAAGFYKVERCAIHPPETVGVQSWHWQLAQEPAEDEHLGIGNMDSSSMASTTEEAHLSRPEAECRSWSARLPMEL